MESDTGSADDSGRSEDDEDSVGSTEIIYKAPDGYQPTPLIGGAEIYGSPDPNQVTLTQTTQIRHQGPLPEPSQFAKYEAAHAGAAAWILNEASAAASHLRDMEKGTLKIQGRDALLPRLLPFGFVLSFLAASVIIAAMSKNAAWGAAGIGGTLVAVGIAYLKGAHGQPKAKSAPPDVANREAA